MFFCKYSKKIIKLYVKVCLLYKYCKKIIKVYGSAELVDMTGIKQLTIQSLMAGNGDLQVNFIYI